MSDFTVIFIMLTINKTQLISQHRDQAVWPVYIIIDNLNRATQYIQKRPEIYLLKLLFIFCRDEDSELKTEIYHTDIKCMLEYMSFIMNLDYVINCFCDIVLKKVS